MSIADESLTANCQVAPEEPQSAACEPTVRPIQQLSKEVVNRIAAGEVIQRPANAVKELLENCLDAGSTHIQITVRDGGLKLLQVQDNGCGIRLADLPILCERFTTSKIKEFADLTSLTTFGFRGEALASLSHVSLLTVTTRTIDQNCAYRLSYRNGVPIGNAAPCAGNAGTSILAEDMFYNTPIRRTALRSAREEFARVAEVVAQYAIHYAPKCGFHLRALNAGSVASTGSDLRTNAGWSRMDAVRAVVGASVAQNLVPFSSSQPGTSEVTRLAVERLGLRYEGLLTTPSQITSGMNPSLKLNLFINNRMVECTVIKRALESSYAAVLSRAMQSSSTTASPSGRRGHSLSGVFRSPGLRSISTSTLFVYLNIQLPASDLDVNVHPTKAEVHFLHEEQIVTGIQDAVEHCLLGCAQIRSFLTRPLLLSESSPTVVGSKSDPEACTAGTPPRSATFRPQDKVRVDAREQRLERFITPVRQIDATTVNRTPLSDLTATPVPPGSPSLGHRQINGSPTLDDDDTKDSLEPVLDTENCPPIDCCIEAAVSQNSLHTLENTEQQFSLSSKDVSDSPGLTGKPVVHSGVPTSHTKPNLSSLSPPELLRPSSSVLVSTGQRTLPPIPKRRVVRLDSVLTMRKRLLSSVDEQARRMLRACKFIGSIDRLRCLVQHSTDLLLVRLQPLTRAFFYQLLVMQFANHGELVLSEPVLLRDLIKLGQSRLPPDDPCRSECSVERITETLVRHAAMLWDYFSLSIEPGADGHAALFGIPLLLDKYVPDLNRLPILLTRLGTEVNWTEEAACFEAVCGILADFYAVSPSLDPASDELEPISRSADSECATGPETTATPWRVWMIEHVLWPALSSALLPVRGLLYEETAATSSITTPEPRSSGPAFYRLTRLTDLYKVFERC